MQIIRQIPRSRELLVRMVEVSMLEGILKPGRPLGVRPLRPICGVITPQRHLSSRRDSLHLNHTRHNRTMEVLGCLLVILAATAGQAHARGQDDIPSTIQERLDQYMSGCVPACRITETEDGRRSYCFGCRDYVVHNLDKLGRSSPPRQTTGPSYGGFRLEVARAKVQEITGAAGVSMLGRVRTDCYWFVYTNHYELAGDDSIVTLRFEFGAGTDPSILNSVRKLLSLDAKEVATDSVHPVDLKVIETCVTQTLARHHVDVSTRKNGSISAWEYHTKEFYVHAVNENGRVDLKAGKINGPAHDGFIVRVVNVQIARTPGQDLEFYSRSKTRYWTVYRSLYWGPPATFRLEILYGQKADKQILTDVIEGINAICAPPGRL